MGMSFAIVKKIEKMGCKAGSVNKNVVITDCGVIQNRMEERGFWSKSLNIFWYHRLLQRLYMTESFGEYSSNFAVQKLYKDEFISNK
jgi:hypothetical protein